MKKVQMPMPEDFCDRFNTIMADSDWLTDDEYSMFIDDILTAMENRLKVLVQ